MICSTVATSSTGEGLDPELAGEGLDPQLAGEGLDPQLAGEGLDLDPQLAGEGLDLDPQLAGEGLADLSRGTGSDLEVPGVNNARKPRLAL